MAAKGTPDLMWLHYILWCGFSVAGVVAFSAAAGTLSLTHAATAIKLVSLGGIFLHLLHWALHVGLYVPDQSKRRRYLLCAKGTLTCTALAALVLSVYLAIYAVKLRGGNVPLPRLDGYYWGIGLLLLLNVVALIPIIALAMANRVIIQGERSTHDSRLYAGAWTFYNLVDLPCLVAAVTLLVCAAVSSMFVKLDEVATMLSGAMAFLVFVVFFAESFLVSKVDT